LSDASLPDMSNNRGGRMKGSIKAAKKIALKKLHDATTTAASSFAIAQEQSHSQGCRVANGTFAGIIRKTESESDCGDGTIKFATVLNRVKRNNVSGTSKQRVPPLSDIKPLLAEYCMKLAQIGSP
jgi:hypothetical protein